MRIQYSFLAYDFCVTESKDNTYFPHLFGFFSMF